MVHRRAQIGTSQRGRKPSLTVDGLRPALHEFLHGFHGIGIASTTEREQFDERHRHWLRSASTGSTRAARRAGSQAARAATPSSTTAMPVKVTGSVPLTP